MLLNINNIHIDTDYPEEYIESILELLPHCLHNSISDRLTAYKEFEATEARLIKDVDDAENRYCAAQNYRDEAQDLIDNITSKLTDKDIIGALKFIRSKLDSI